MPNATQGSVASLWRYPVKSMQGEELTATEVTERGLLGDRAYALIDSVDGKAATAKQPKQLALPCSFHRCNSNELAASNGERSVANTYPPGRIGH